jgi:hypothetical protein
MCVVRGQGIGRTKSYTVGLAYVVLTSQAFTSDLTAMASSSHACADREDEAGKSIATCV